jgi:dinuclear metal center YbgI/SA1388 family protein
MKIENIYKFLDEISPFELQQKWDNSGLIVGNMSDKFKQVYISFDLDLDLLDNIENGSLIITHHPLILKPLKVINNHSYSAKLLQILIKKDIKLISMHTNFDKTHLNKYVGNVLGFNFKQVDDFILEAKVDISFKKLQKIVSNRLNLEILKVVESKKDIKSIALCTGAGMSLLSSIKADCFLTGDIKYHEAMEAKALGISLIDIGHFESEIFFSEILYKLLENYLKKNKIKGIMSTSQNPFKIYKRKIN